jgi:predicted nucleotidyltransferase component of viral defense system
MNSYYEDILYPLQNNVLSILDNLKTPFYLTGGTALSRFYYHHRYSNDLDFFVNSYNDFISDTEKILQQLTPLGIEITLRTESMYSARIAQKLKVDFINDTGSYPTGFLSTPLFSKIDKSERILANKIMAVTSRDEAKDIVDIWVIAKNISINWKEIFVDASSRAAGIFPPMVAERLNDFPIELLKRIKWKEEKEPNASDFQRDIQIIIDSILSIPNS